MNPITQRWPWFSLAASLMLVACLASNGIVAGLAALGALLSFLGACIHRLAQDVRDDPERLAPIVREIGIAGLIAIELRHQQTHRA